MTKFASRSSRPLSLSHGAQRLVEFRWSTSEHFGDTERDAFETSPDTNAAASKQKIRKTRRFENDLMLNTPNGEHARRMQRPPSTKQAHQRARFWHQDDLISSMGGHCSCTSTVQKHNHNNHIFSPGGVWGFRNEM